MANQIQQFIDTLNRLEKVFGTLPNKAATIAVNFSKDRFRQANWIGDRTVNWKKRKRSKGPKG